MSKPINAAEHAAASKGRVPAMGKWQTAQLVKVRQDDVNAVLSGIADGDLMLEYWFQWELCSGGHRHDAVMGRLCSGVGLTLCHLNTVPNGKGTVADILSKRHAAASATAAKNAPQRVELTA